MPAAGSCKIEHSQAESRSQPFDFAQSLDSAATFGGQNRNRIRLTYAQATTPRKRGLLLWYTIRNRMRRTNIAGSVAYWSLLFLFGFLPFFFIPTVWAPIAQAKMLLVGILVVVATVAWVASALSEEVVRMPRSWLFYAVLLVPLAYFISAIATGASRTSLIGGEAHQDTVVTVFILYALFVVCSSILSRGNRRLITAVSVFIAGSTVALLFQLVRLAYPSFTFGDVLIARTASVVGGWHDLGIFLGLLLFLSLALLSASFVGSRWWKCFLFCIAGISALLLVVVNFRDVWIGISALSAAYGAYLWITSRRDSSPLEGAGVTTRMSPGDMAEVRTPQREFGGSSGYSRRYLWWFVLAIVSLGFVFGGASLQRTLPDALQITHIEVRPSWRGTYAVGSRVFTQPSSIFFGSGPNTFPREWRMYKPLGVNFTEFWNVDFYSGVGFIPTSFVTVGLLGVVAWGAVILALLMSVLSLMRRRAESSKANVTLSLLVGAAVYLTAYHVLYVPGPALSALTFMFFGFLVAGELLTGSVRERVWAPSLDPWKYYVSVGVLTVFALLILFGGLQFARTLVSGMLVNRSVTIYNSTQNIENASRSVNTALKVLPANDRAHRAAIELGLLQLKQLISSGDESSEARTQLQNILTSTIQHGLTAVSIESTNYQNWLSLARLYGELAGVGVEGAEERARSAYEEARKSSTTNPYPLLALAQLDLLKKDESSARANLLSALELKPNLAMALFLLSQIDARAGDLAEAAKSAEEVVRVVPEDSLGWYNLGTIYYVSGKYENSTAALGRAVGLKNDYANALFLLSASYAALERFDDARTALREVIALNPSVTSLPEMLARLEKGENPFAPSDNNAVDQ